MTTPPCPRFPLAPSDIHMVEPSDNDAGRGLLMHCSCGTFWTDGQVYPTPVPEKHGTTRLGRPPKMRDRVSSKNGMVLG